MTVNIKQEILDWYNEPAGSEEEKETSINSEVWEEFYWAITTKERADAHGTKTATLESGPAYSVEDFGGEGQGETRYVVFQVADQFFRVDGYYASWDGTTWEDPTPYEVEPREVTVIRYERKK
jgi:hypothetical protein